ncbi:MAG: site-2 protease family protein [Oscillospiraceae bacterium]|nr:site-2 protease family protein [Oscillospiraceae bacterium]
MTAIILAILFFVITITLHELGHFLIAKLSGIKVNEFAIGMGPKIFSWGKGETKYSLRALPIGGYIAMEEENGNSDDKRSFENSPIYKRIFVILSGAIVNIFTGFVIMGIIVGAQGQFVSTEVASIKPNVQQIQVGDKIKKVNGHNISCANDCKFELSRVSENEQINLTVCRNQDIIELNDVGYLVITDSGTYRTLGITLSVKDLNFTDFFDQTFSNSIFYVKMVWVSFCDLVTGKVPLDNLSGPVGVTRTINEAQNNGIFSILSLFSLLSINIGIFNLLPFPALDGGQFIFLIIELIFRRPIKKEIKGIINGVGIILWISLFVFITIKDVFLLF